MVILSYTMILDIVKNYGQMQPMQQQLQLQRPQKGKNIDIAAEITVTNRFATH